MVMEEVASHRSRNVTINDPANGIIDKPTQPCWWYCSRIGLTLHLPQFIKVQVAIVINLTRTLIARIPERLNFTLPCPTQHTPRVVVCGRQNGRVKVRVQPKVYEGNRKRRATLGVNQLFEHN